jgi:IS30 family transposase
VSHETIYRSLFVQTRGVLKKELLSHLRSKRSMRRSQPVDPNGDRQGHIKDIVSIRQRPAAVTQSSSVSMTPSKMASPICPI